MVAKTTRKIEEFDWSLYESGWKGGVGLQENPKIKTQSGDKVFCHESYAKNLYKMYCNSGALDIKKDLQTGDLVLITNLIPIDQTSVTIELLGGLTVALDLKREKKFIQMFGYNTPQDFVNAMYSPEYRKNFIDLSNNAFILEGGSYPKISLWQGYVKRMKDEFMEQIANPTSAYVAKIISANKGGYFVQINGVDAFMPGSLAAPNKIIDFKSMVDKEVIVMIEDYLSDINSFIVSHKKYIEYILPTKLAELDKNTLYEGTITGTSKFGIFIEFNNFFTGLLHISKMSEDTKTVFQLGKFNPGDSISFWIDEINKDNRIVLTEESPVDKINTINKFIEDNKDEILTCKVLEIYSGGIKVSVDNMIGLVPIKEIKRAKIMTRNIMTGDKFTVLCDTINKDNLLIFKLNV